MTDMIFFTDGEERFRIPFPTTHGTKCPETKLEIKKMTIRAQELLDSTMELTLRPQKDDRKKLIAFIINEVAARLCTDWAEGQMPQDVLYEIADEVETL
jgi:hypothetical protein